MRQTPIRVGSGAHRDLFCDALVQTHRTYDPDHLPWPDLDDTALAALRALPFWAEAITTERSAGATITAYAATVQDRVLREALQLQAEEERRHARLVEALTSRYRIAVEPRPMPPPAADVELAFVDLGYGECVDSFFAFGLFALARRTGFVPDALLQLMEPVVAEEARHIVFFVNWEAYHQTLCGPRPTVLRRARSCRYYLRAARRRLGALRSARGAGFTASGARSVRVDLRAREFLETCLHENAIRLGGFDSRLVRPRLLPALARIALGALRVAGRITAHKTRRPVAGSRSR